MDHKRGRERERVIKKRNKERDREREIIERQMGK